VNDWLAGVLFRFALRICSDRHAYMLYRLQAIYWEELPEGRALRRQWEDGEAR
jgi:hypothetical protein